MTTPYAAVVLFVHGIGQQKPGHTLAEFGGSLVTTSEAWYGAANVAYAPQPPASDTPLHGELLLRRPGRETLRALLVESHWADEVKAPTWRPLMTWLVDVVPFLVQRAADQLMRRTSRQIDARKERADPPEAQTQTQPNPWLWLEVAGFGAARLVLNVPAVIATVVISVLLVMLGIAGGFKSFRDWLFGKPPQPIGLGMKLLTASTIVAIAGTLAAADLPRIGCVAFVALVALAALIVAARQLQALLVGFIGDSYALLHSRETAQKIEDKVRLDLDWIEKQHPGRPVVIVAHSQGAEVVHRVLAGRTTNKPLAGFVTFGSAIAKLHAVGKLRERRWHARAAFGLRVVSAALVGVIVVAAVGGDRPDRVGAVVLLIPAVLALARARSELKRIVGRNHEADALRIGCERVAHWSDLHASHDLVSEGHLPVGERTRGYSKTIANRRSLILDHVKYWRNIEGFHGAVALELERVADGLADPLRREELDDAATARTRRINVIYAVRMATGVVVIALLFALELSLCGVGLAFALGAAIAYVAVARVLHARLARRTHALLARQG